MTLELRCIHHHHQPQYTHVTHKVAHAKFLANIHSLTHTHTHTHTRHTTLTQHTDILTLTQHTHSHTDTQTHTHTLTHTLYQAHTAHYTRQIQSYLQSI